METICEKPRLRLVKSSFQPDFANGRLSLPTARSNSVYYQRIESYARKIRQTDSVAEITKILDQALTETRALEHQAHSHTNAGKIDHAKWEVKSLQTELEQMRKLVYVDHLTGMLNRGGLKDSFAREAARADRAGRLLAVALLDIDDFKALNDQYGHQAGDDALVHLSSAIRRTMRPSDIVVRYGGEEFLFLLPDANAKQANLALHRVQYDLDRQPMVQSGEKIALTFSAGIAIRGENESRDSVIARADAGMYAAKRAGKRQICNASAIGL